MAESQTPTLPPFLTYRNQPYLADLWYWPKWRLTFEAGERFRDRYLEQFSHRETTEDYNARKSLTPIPAFAKQALKEVRNSIFQRLPDVVRRDGSANYHAAIAGLRGGVDNRGSTMNYFLGHKVLTEMLVMGRAGIFVDMPEIPQGSTLAETGGKHPYIYCYPVEDILNYSMTFSENESEFQSLLLRDCVQHYDQKSRLPLAITERYRLMWVEEGKVKLQFYDMQGLPIDSDGTPNSTPKTLDISRIPFVLPDIGDSLLRDCADYQIALLNFVSLDANFEFKSNFPFYTEQKDIRSAGEHLKKVASDGTSSTGGQGSTDETISVGATHGRYYGKGMERPMFIAPPVDPLNASLEVQKKWEGDIRKMVSLAVQTLATRSSAVSKQIDNQGLEAGLSYIGCVLENTERRIGDYWAAYEEQSPKQRQIPTIKYPDRYSLKSQQERLDEAATLKEVGLALPSKTAKKEVSKNIAAVMLEGRIKPEQMQTIYDEIDKANYTTSDPDVIIQASMNGLCGNETASEALGFDGKVEAKKAAGDHADKLARIAESQAAGPGASDPGARGVSALSGNPKAGSEEKAASRDTTQKSTNEPAVRGKGQ